MLRRDRRIVWESSATAFRNENLDPGMIARAVRQEEVSDSV
jgi:hypothetical protein